MANVVLCSELGRGVAHMARLADFAIELQARGHALRLVCNDLKAANAMDEFARASIFPAPIPDRGTAKPHDDRPQNYASLLLSNSFRDVDTLIPVLRSWLHLLATLDADLVVTDDAPTALLASRLLMIPSVMTGVGYTVPPLRHPLPSLMPWRESREGVNAIDHDLSVEDKKLVDITNQALEHLKFSNVTLKEAQEIFSHAAQWVMTAPEIDHYGGRDVNYVFQRASKVSTGRPRWPKSSSTTVDGEKVFVYMDAHAPHLSEALTQLRKLGLPTLAVVPNASNEFINKYEASSITIQRDMVDLDLVFEQCRVFINQGEHDSVYDLLMMGVPSIMLPHTSRDTLFAYRIAKSELGFAGPVKASRLDIAQLINYVDQHDQVWHNCSQMSLKYTDGEGLERLHDLVSAKLPVKPM